MAQQLADRRDQDFVIWEQFDNEKLIETIVPTSIGKMMGIKSMSTAAMDMEADAYASL